MVTTLSLNSTIKCLLCQGSINLSLGNLDKFRHHLESSHDNVHDQDLVVAVSFLETEEKERIVETVFPRIKKFFQDIKAKVGQETPRQGLDKRLLEEEESSLTNISSFHRENKKRKLEHSSSKYESLSESHGNQESSSRFKGSNSDSSPTFSYCSTCNLSVPTSKLEEHMKNIHTSSSEETTEERNTEDMEEKVANPGEAKCDICEKVMLKKSIKKHKQRVHQLYESLKNLAETGAEDSIAEAEEETDTNDISIDNSLLEPQVELEENPKLATCNFCFAKISKTNLSRHIKAKHSSKEPSNETAVDEEETEEGDNAREDHRCKICFARFDELDEMKEHFKDVHDLDYETAVEDEDVQMEDTEEKTEQEFSCDQCDAKYTIKDSLRRHKRNKH